MFFSFLPFVSLPGKTKSISTIGIITDASAQPKEKPA
jgi:hypothetical protein